MNILIVDFHAGCIASAATTFLDLGHEVTILSLSGHTHLLENIGLSRHLVRGDQEKALLSQLGLARDISVKNSVRSRKWRHRASAPSFDLAYVFFPPGLYQRVLASKMAKKVVVVASHRFDLWFDKAGSRKKFHERIKSDVLHERIFLYAANEFDQSYIDYYLGIQVEVLPPSFPYLDGPLALGTRNSQIPLIGPAHVRPEAVDFLTSLQCKLLNPPKAIKELYGNYTFEDLANHSRILLFPYSIYSISLSELASLGLLMLFPTDRWLQKSHILDDVQLFPHYAKERHVSSFISISLDSQSDPNLGELKLEWIGRASWKKFPNVLYWDSEEELRDLLNQNVGVVQVEECVKRAQVWNQNNLDLWIQSLRKLEKIVKNQIP